MALLPDNYGLGFLMEKGVLENFASLILEEGAELPGYYGETYLFKSFGKSEYWAAVMKDGDGKVKFEGFHSHCCGSCFWDMVCTGIDLTPETSSKTERTLLLGTLCEPRAVLPVNLINVDILPSIMQGERLTVQVIALPTQIKYYENEEAFIAAESMDCSESSWDIGVGNLFPLGFISNHIDQGQDEIKNQFSDAVVQFTGKVAYFRDGLFGITDEHTLFIRCYAETKFGLMEFNHTIDQVPEEMQKNLKAGAIISGQCILSGDVAIYEYEYGMLKDFQHNLSLLQYTFENGDPERLRSVLKSDTVYSSEASGVQILGAEDIIAHIKKVKKYKKCQYRPQLATLIESDENLPYPEGMRCIVLNVEGEEKPESIAFIQVDETGMIEKIEISMDERYRFEID